MARIVQLRGAVNIAQYRKLKRAGGKLPYPLGQDKILERATIRRLEERGIVRRDHAAGTYELEPSVQVRHHTPVLERLRHGPLLSCDWEDVAMSRASLRVQIAQLKRRGFNITATVDRSQSHRSSGKAPVRYELKR